MRTKEDIDAIWDRVNSEEGRKQFAEYLKTGSCYIQKANLPYEVIANMYMGMIATSAELDYKKALSWILHSVESEKAAMKAMTSGASYQEMVDGVHQATSKFIEKMGYLDSNKEK